MDVGVLAVRYAKALIGYATENGVEGELYSLSQNLLHSFKERSDIHSVLGDPLLPEGEKVKVLLSAAGLSGDSPSRVREVFVTFLSLVLRHRRGSYMTAIFRHYIELYRRAHGITLARITTAVPLDDAMAERILEKSSHLLNKKIELERVIDPDIEGGFIFDVDDYRLDASIATGLRKIRNQFLDKNKRIV